jgi:hypothetical protein
MLTSDLFAAFISLHINNRHLSDQINAACQLFPRYSSAVATWYVNSMPSHPSLIFLPHEAYANKRQKEAKKEE